jgi:integrase
MAALCRHRLRNLVAGGRLGNESTPPTTHAVPPMIKLSPTTLTRSDQLAPLEAAIPSPREALLVALGTGLRVAEIVGLDVGDGRPNNPFRRMI